MIAHGLWLVGALPIVVGLALPRLRSGDDAWRLALATATGTVLLALLAAGVAYGLAPGRLVRDAEIPGVGLDGLTAALLPAVALFAWTAIAARPARGRSRAGLASLLAAVGAFLLTYLAVGFDLLLVGWVLSFALPLLERFEDGVSRRPIVLAGVLSTLPLLAVEGLLLATGSPRDFAALLAAPPADPVRAAIYGLVVLAGVIRAGLLPFSSWPLAALSRAAIGLPLVLVAARPTVFLLLRVAVPLAPDVHARAAPWLAGLGIATALFAGVLGLVQRDLRRMLGALALSHSGLVFTGLCALDPLATTGARVQWLNVGIALLGLAVVVEALEARLGREALAEARGLAARVPGLAASFLLFGICAVGFPGTLGFVGEDLMVRGTVARQPVLAALILAVTALNGIMLFQAFFRVFLGPAPAGTPWPAPLVPRERFVLLPLLLALLGFGLFPSGLVRARSDAVIARELRGAELVGALRARPPDP